MFAVKKREFAANIARKINLHLYCRLINLKTVYEGELLIKSVFGRKPIFFTILLNDPLCISFMYANFLLEWNNHLKDIFKTSRKHAYIILTPLNPTFI